MATIIKVRCNGSGKHVNEVDIDELTKPTLVIRGPAGEKLRDRYVVHCKHCSQGDVIVTREMIEKAREK